MFSVVLIFGSRLIIALHTRNQLHTNYETTIKIKMIPVKLNSRPLDCRLDVVGLNPNEIVSTFANARKVAENKQTQQYRQY